MTIVMLEKVNLELKTENSENDLFFFNFNYFIEELLLFLYGNIFLKNLLKLI